MAVARTQSAEQNSERQDVPPPHPHRYHWEGGAMLSCAGAADGCTFRVRSLHIKGLPPSAASPPLAHAQRSHAVGAARAARASYAPHRRGGGGGMALANILIVALLPLLAACAAAAARRAKQAATWTEVRRVIPPPPFCVFGPMSSPPIWLLMMCYLYMRTGVSVLLNMKKQVAVTFGSTALELAHVAVEFGVAAYAHARTVRSLLNPPPSSPD